MIQAVIARLATNNAAHKNYCVTLVAAAIGLAATLQKPFVAAIALIPILIFAFLDAQYLRIEKRYRDLYDEVRLEASDRPPDFRLHVNGAKVVSFSSVLRSWSVQGFYLPTFVGVFLVIIALEVLYGRTF
ncbi:hypothetical protein V3589_10930 [Sinorhizobium fredii]|uniref:hypothetical protein n=1 Tax=Rhizobium fredii TaxID=380 RepID=UPI0030A96591